MSHPNEERYNTHILVVVSVNVNVNVNEYVHTADDRKLHATYGIALPGIVVPTGELHTLTDSETDGRIWTNVVGAIIGAGTDYVSQVAAKAIIRGGLTTECFTTVSGTQIALAAAAGFISSGASALGASAARSVASGTGSKIAGKVVGKIAEEGTEFLANVVSQGGKLGEATQNYAFGKTIKVIDLKMVVPQSNNKALKSAIEDARSHGKSLTTRQKNKIRSKNEELKKNVSEINEKRKKINDTKDLLLNTVYGTYRQYQDKTRKWAN